VLVSTRNGSKDKVGKDSSRRLMEWRGSVVEATSVSCRINYIGIRKVLGYTRRQVRHARKISQAGRWLPRSLVVNALERAAQGDGSAQTMVNGGGWAASGSACVSLRRKRKKREKEEK
jgi:hypothetical protein